MRHLVVKKINGPENVVYTPGMEVDATDWKWETLLVEQRKLAPIPDRAPTKKEMMRPSLQATRLKTHLAPPKVGKSQKEKV